MQITSLRAATLALATLAMAAGVQAQTVTGAGASFPAPIYAKWADAYNKATGARINYQSVGSSAGISQIKAKTVEIADTKMKLDAAAKADELALAREKMEKELELKGMQLGVDVEKSRTDLAANQMAEGTRIGAQIARDKARDRLDQKKLDKPTPPKPSKP